MTWALTRESVASPRFAWFDLCLVLLSGVAVGLRPQLGMYAIAASLLPWVARLLAGSAPFRRTRFDLCVAVYALTAVAGYWAAYDPSTGLQKLQLIVLSVLLYYALSAQPGENLVWVAALFFCVGVGVALYFLLTQDFIADPRKLQIANEVGRLLMQARPSTGLAQIHPNYAAGLIAIMMPFGIYLALQGLGRSAFAWAIVGLLLQALVIFLATSRGVWMAVASAIGIGFAGQILLAPRIKLKWRNEAVFPVFVLIFLAALILLLYFGPTSIGGSISGNDSYGTGARAELFWRSLRLVLDFPFTGGGLGAFPGLYSQYILGIPNYYLPNAHNIFLDVFIEQGIFGGAAFLFIFLASLWLIASKSVGEDSPHQLFDRVLLAALVIAVAHGLVDDYLYNNLGAMLGLFLPGLAARGLASKPLNPLPKQFDRADIIVLGSITVLLIALGAVYWNTFRSLWYANIGAVQMARVELDGFPTNEWAGPALADKLQDAEASLHASLTADSANRTANHRLGLIALLRRDIPSACGYLSNAHLLDPAHRGITKSLGYCYAWLGDLESSKILLRSMPEAWKELSEYVRWWQAQGYVEFSNNASALAVELRQSQP
ncbi:MAG TPA: O-antigen ligase family protein [Anaerolineales bacterium]|nr:O-antigen ligase family protein [Anaerolineales bacterium]